MQKESTMKVTQTDFFDVIRSGKVLTPTDRGHVHGMLTARGYELVREGRNANGRRVMIYKRKGGSK